jgi:hypothetical protein
MKSAIDGDETAKASPPAKSTLGALASWLMQ